MTFVIRGFMTKVAIMIVCESLDDATDSHKLDSTVKSSELILLCRSWLDGQVRMLEAGPAFCLCMLRPMTIQLER